MSVRRSCASRFLTPLLPKMHEAKRISKPIPYFKPALTEEDIKPIKCHRCEVTDDNDSDAGLVTQAEGKEIYICSKCKQKHVSMSVSKHGYQIWELKTFRQETLNL